MPQELSRPMIAPRGRGLRLAFAVLCVGSCVALGGCSVPLADLPVVGVPAGAPARPTDAGAYPAVHDMPEARSEPVMDPAEQAKVEKDLKTARDRQAGGTKSADKTADKTSQKSAAKTADQ